MILIFNGPSFNSGSPESMNGGGGCVVFDGSGPPAGSVTTPTPINGSQNGFGYGAGGGSGCYGVGSFGGGHGAPGFVYVEWY